MAGPLRRSLGKGGGRVTAADRAAHRYAIGHMAAYFIAFCLGALFALVVGSIA